MPKIVIDMDEETYRSIVDKYDTFPAEWKRWGLGAIKNGTLLSKVFEDIREKVKFEIGGFEDSVDKIGRAHV